MQRSLLWHPPFRRWVTVVATAGYLAAVWGVPLPIPAAKQGRPFPCQDHRCGCSSADQCWHSCCCYSASQKLAWAKRHQVEVPQEHRVQLVAAAKRESSCSHEGQTTCCSAKPAASQQRSCCSSPESEPKAEPAPAAPSIDFVSAIAMRTCRGLPTLWCVSGAVTPPPAPIQWRFEWQLVARLESIDGKSIDCFDVPTSPPPEV